VRCPCRGRHDPKPTAADRRYWLDRFTLDEIRDLAEGIWPS
jgi:hypothetical protein